MNDTAVLVTIAIFFISHLCLAIWFASQMKAKVIEIANDVTEMTAAIKEMAVMNTRITVLESRMARTEADTREALKAAALLGHSKE